MSGTVVTTEIGGLSVRSLLGSFIFWRFLSRREGIGDTLNIEDQRDTGKHPLRRSMLGLELCGEHVRLVSVGGHVARTLVDTLINLAFYNQLGSAVDQGHDRELLLGDRLFHKSGILVPGSTF